MRYQSCSWCNTLNEGKYCRECGHRADLPRMWCDCSQCKPTDETSTFETVAQNVEFELEGHEADALLNHEVMSDQLNWLFKNDR